jgi:hypothetical protein
MSHASRCWLAFLIFHDCYLIPTWLVQEQKLAQVETNQSIMTAPCAGHDAVQKVTLIPRGQARGLTWFIPGEDPTLISKQQIFARIVGALGGRATEQVVFGDAEVTTGASSDLQQVCASVLSLVVFCVVCWQGCLKSACVRCITITDTCQSQLHIWRYMLCVLTQLCLRVTDTKLQVCSKTPLQAPVSAL